MPVLMLLGSARHSHQEEEQAGAKKGCSSGCRHTPDHEVEGVDLPALRLVYGAVPDHRQRAHAAAPECAAQWAVSGIPFSERVLQAGVHFRHDAPFTLRGKTTGFLYASAITALLDCLAELL